MRTEGPNKTVPRLVEDVLRPSGRVDPQAIQEKKLLVLVRSMNNDIFGGLVRNPPTTVNKFIAEATNIERALSVRASHYNRLAGTPVASALGSPRIDQDGIGADNLPEIVREVVREELRKLLLAADCPASISIAEVAREEVQRVFQPEAPVTVTAPEEPTLSYAAIEI